MSATSAFFERLAATDHDPRFDKVRGSVRFDIRDGDQVQRWLLAIDHGRLRVTRDDGPAGLSSGCPRRWRSRWRWAR